MTKTRTCAAACILLVVTACSKKTSDSSSAPAPPAPPASGAVVHTNPHFRVTLPAGWQVEKARPEPTEVLGTVSEEGIALHALGPDGYYFDVWFECPGTETSGDARWKVRADEAGRAVAKIDEADESCTQESAKACVKRYQDDPNALGPGPMFCHCSVGDRKLEIWAAFEGKHPFAGTNGVCFHLGNGVREDADREPLRAIVRSFRLDGQVDAPAPVLPLPAAMKKTLDEASQQARERQHAPATAEPGSSCVAAAEGGPGDVVRLLYAAYPADGPTAVTNEPRTVLERYFDSNMVALLLEDHACRERSQGVCRINWAILFDAQDVALADLRFCRSDRGTDWVDVRFKNHGEDQVVAIRAAHTAAGWRVADLVSPGEMSLAKALSQPLLNAACWRPRRGSDLKRRERARGSGRMRAARRN